MKPELKGPRRRNPEPREAAHAPQEERTPTEAGTVVLEPLPTWRSGKHLVDIANRDALYRVMEEEAVVDPPADS